MNMFKKIRLFLGNYIAVRYFRRWRDRKQFERWQERRIIRHLDYIRTRSSFYRTLWGEKEAHDWRSFPLINKKIMMDNFDTLNTVGVKKEEAFSVALQAEASRDFTPTINDVTIGLSSGTSGNRGLFLVSPEERISWAGTMLARLLPGSLLRAERVAFFLRADSNLYRTVQGKKLQFKFFDLLNPLTQHIEELHDYTPTLLVAPPSMLRMLADAINSGDLWLTTMPHKVIAVAEVLDPLDRQHIEAAFNQRVHQVYQCTEGFLATTCRYGTLHLNEDVVAIEKEYIDRESGKFVPIVTDFSRYSQPIVRYRLDDILTEAPPCRCGSIYTAIQSIEGRCDDCFYLPSLTGTQQLLPVFPDFISRAIMAAPHVLAYYALQKSPAEIEIRLRLPLEDWTAGTAAIDSALQQLFARTGCQNPLISYLVDEEDKASHAPYRKLRRVERRFAVNV